MKPTLITNLENGKEPIDATLLALAALAWTAGNQIPVFTGNDVFALRTVGQGAGNILDKAAGDALYQALGSYQPLDGTLTALAAASWTAGTQILSLTANDVITLNTVGQGAGNILDKTAGDALYQAISANLSAYAGAAWSAGKQIPALTAANTISLQTVGSATGNILDKASGDILYQPLSANLTGLTGLSATVGLLEQTGANAFSKRAIGVVGATDILQRSDGDARFAAIAHATSALTASGHTVSATARLLGRNSVGSGAVEELTGTTTTALLDLATGSLKGLMSASDFTKLAGVASGATANTGTVTTVSVTSQNGVSASVTNAGTTPTLAFTLGAITPSSILSSGSISATGGSILSSVALNGTSKLNLYAVNGGAFAESYNGSAYETFTLNGSSLAMQISGATKATLSGTGLAVTGTVSATSTISATNISGDVYARAITATAADTVNVCTIAQTNLSTIVEVVVSLHTASYKQTKVYVVPLKSNQTGTNWHRLVPLLNSEGTDNVELDAQINGDTTTLRLRRTAGTNAATAQVSVNLRGDITGTALSGSSTTGSAGSVTQDYVLSSLEQLSNNSVRVKNLEMRGQAIPTFTIYNDQTLAGSILVENGGVKAISNGGPLRLDTANSNAVLIGHNGGTVFNTISTGVEITGDLNTKNSTGGVNIRKGDGTYVGSIKVSTNDLLTNSSGINKQDGDLGVILSHAAATKLATLSTGISVTGTLSASGLLSGSNFSGASSGTNTGDQTITLTGDVAGSGTASFAATVAAGAITLAKQANLAANSIIGNNTGVGATPLALTGTQVTAMLDSFTSTLKGLAPASGGGTANYLRADGSWATPPNTGVWGSITGTLSSQTDLQTALNAKANLTGGNTITGNQSVDGTVTLANASTKGIQFFDATYGGGVLKFYGVSTATQIAQLGVSYDGSGHFIHAASDHTFKDATLANTWLTINSTGLAATGTISASNFSGTSSGTNTGNQTITLTGNVTGSGTGSFATTIAANAVTDAMLTQVPTGTFKGRISAATGNIEVLTGTQATAMLDSFTSALKGLVPASGGGSVNFLRGDGVWADPLPTATGFSPFATAGTGASQNITLPSSSTSSQLFVFVNGIYQTPDTHYTVTGTTLNITTSSVGDSILIVRPGAALGGGAGTWGTITGTLSTQTDLQTALNAKAALSGATFTGTVAVPTATADTNSTTAASTAFVQNSLSTVTISTTGGATTLTSAQAGSAIIVVTGTLTTNATISLGSGSAAFFNRRYTIVNATTGSFTLSVQACVTGPGPSVSVIQGRNLAVNANGANVTADSAPALVDLTTSIEGQPTASQRLMRYKSNRAITLVQADSLGDADVAATASTVFAIKIGGVSAGSITFGSGATVGTVALTSTAVAAGVLLEVIAPATPDATLNRITITLGAFR